MANLGRKEKSTRNIVTGMVRQIVMLVFPFINRTVMIYILGAEYTGLSSLFSSVLSVLNLADLGFSDAIVVNLYKPIDEQDKETVSYYLALYRKIYFVVGLIILLGGLIISPFLRFLINGEPPKEINIYVLFYLYLLNTVIGYFLFSYKQALLIADQRKDVLDVIRLGAFVIQSLIQILTIFIWKNYYWYLIVSIVGTMACNFVCEIYTRRKYVAYNYKKGVSLKIPDSMKANVGALMIDKICSICRNSLDNIITTAFLGLVATTIYGNYFYVYSSVYAIALVVERAIIPSLGNSLCSESGDNNYKKYMTIYLLFICVAGVFTSGAVSGYQDFMRIWVGDKLMLKNYQMFFFGIYLFVSIVHLPCNAFFDAAGLWHKIKKLYIIEAIANLILNICLGHYWGITGIILATIITVAGLLPIRLGILEKELFRNKDNRKGVKQYWWNLVTDIIVIGLSYRITTFISISGLQGFLIKVVIGMCISGILLLLLFKPSMYYKNLMEYIIYFVTSIRRRKGR